MVQARQDGALRSRYAQPAVMQAATGSTRTACEQLEQLNRKLAAAHAEIRRYQTKLFACEREILALRKENAELEAACEQAREEAAQAQARAEQLPQETREKDLCMQEADAASAQEKVEETAPQETKLPAMETPRPEQQAAAQPPEELEWKPRTELEHLSVELINWFDEMMGA